MSLDLSNIASTMHTVIEHLLEYTPLGATVGTKDKTVTTRVFGIPIREKCVVLYNTELTWFNTTILQPVYSKQKGCNKIKW